MWSEVASAALKLVLALATALISAVLVPYLKTVVVPWLQEKRVYNLCVKFVRAAEKMAETSQISKEDKKEFVIRMLKSRGVQVTPDVDAFIESAVGSLDDFFTTQYAEIADAFVTADDLDGDIEGNTFAGRVTE